MNGRSILSSVSAVFWCSNSTVGNGGIQLRDDINFFGMEELGEFVGICGELRIDLWIPDRPEGFKGSYMFNLFQYIVILWDVLGCFCLAGCGALVVAVGEGRVVCQESWA